MNRLNNGLSFAALALSLAAGQALAQDIYRVKVTGVVENNAFVSGAFAGIPAGSVANTVFDVDSSSFLDSAAFPGRVRAYNLVPGSLKFTMGNVTVGERAGFNRRFAIRNNDPGVDGVYLTQGLEIDTQIPLAIGTTQAFGVAFSRTFNTATVWPSVDIAGAVGTWAFENISSYNYTIELSENVVPAVLEYQQFTIFKICGKSDVAGANQSVGADGSLTADDIIVFLGWFFAADTRADVAGANQSTVPDTALTADDIIVFLGRYFAGC